MLLSVVQAYMSSLRKRVAKDYQKMVAQGTAEDILEVEMLALRISADVINESLFEECTNKIMRHYDTTVSRIQLLRKHGGACNRSEAYLPLFDGSILASSDICIEEQIRRVRIEMNKPRRVSTSGWLK